MSSFIDRTCLVVSTILLLVSSGQSQQTQPPANSYPAYKELRNVGLSGETVTVSNLNLKRDAATFHLRSGTVCFVSAVQGKVTGAVFVGEGNMGLTPPIPVENRMLKLLTKDDEFSENFSQ